MKKIYKPHVAGLDYTAAAVTKDEERADEKQNVGEESAVVDGVVMRLNAGANKIIPNRPHTLCLVPQQKVNANQQVSLEVQHGKKIHLVIVSDDLSWFNHVHPELNEDGQYVVTTSFPHAGNYILYADYKPIGSEHTVDKLLLTVEGVAAAGRIHYEEKLTGFSGPYTFTLKPLNEPLVTGTQSPMLGQIKKGGRPIDINNLPDYLGAKAHIVIIGMQDKEYIHVHPIAHEKNLLVHAVMDNPGAYRVWAQFRDQHQLHTVDLTLYVNEAEHVPNNQHQRLAHEVHKH